MKRIPLTQGFYALVSDVDYKRVSQMKWTAQRTKRPDCVYAVNGGVTVNGKRNRIWMHRFILDVPLNPGRRGPARGFEVDHRDGNGLNNQRSNLRRATTVQNMRNSRVQNRSRTGFKGVWPTRAGRFASVIQVKKTRRVYLGTFTTARAAHRAYVSAAKKLFGEFARA